MSVGQAQPWFELCNISGNSALSQTNGTDGNGGGIGVLESANASFTGCLIEVRAYSTLVGMDER